MKNRRGLIRMTALLICLVMIGTLLPVMASADLAAPVLNSAKADGEGIRVSWSAVSGAEGYRVYRKDAGSGWKAIAKVTGTSYKDSTAKEKVTYTYTVRCLVGGENASDYNHTGVSAAWSKSTAGYTATPKLTGAKANGSGILVTWSKVSGADGYRIYRKAGKVGWKGIASVGNVDKYQDNTAVSGTKYTYTVRSLKGGVVKSDFDAKGVSATYNSGIAPGDIAAPKLIAAVSEGTGLRVSWEPVAGASAYRIYRKSGKNNWAKLVDVSGTNYLDNATNAGTVYYYTVRCLDGSGNLISNFDHTGVKGSWTAPTPGSLATPLLDKAINAANGVTVSWYPVTGAEGYRVYRDNGTGWKAIADVTGTSYTDTTAVSGTPYTYTVRAMQGGKTASGFDHAGVKRTFYAMPKLKTASSVAAGIQITWEASKGAPLYRIYRKTGSAAFSSIGTTTGTSFTDKKVSVGVTYTYTVRVVKPEDIKVSLSAYDHTGISATFTGKSGITSLVNKLNGVEIKWSAVSGAANYQVLRKSGEGNWVELTTTSATSYLDTEAVNNTRHTYRIRAKDSGGNYIGSDDASGVSITYYVAPTLVSCVRSSGGLLTTWEAVAGISNYAIYRRYGVGDWERVGSSTGTTHMDMTPPSGTFCYYTVRCMDGSGNVVSDFRTPGVGQTSYMDQPVLSAAVNGNGTITVSWNSVDKATNYRVYRKTGKKTSWDIVQNNTTALNWTDSSVLKGETYTYSVCVIKSDGSEELSEFNTTGVTVAYYDPPTLTSIANGQNGVDLKWATVDYIGRYQVYRKTGNDVNWVSIGTSSGDTFTDTGVTSNAHYIYAVRGMINGADATANSNTKDITYYAAPKMSSIACNSDSITVAWAQEPGIDTYRVFRSTDGGKNWTNIADVNATSYKDTGATTVGQKYTYTVRCVKGGTLVSAMKNTISATYIKAPTGVSVTGGTKKATVKWNANYSANSYTVKRRTATTGWVTVRTGITTGSFTDTNMPGEGNYIYCVVAVAADGTNSANSAEVTATVN